MAVSKSISLFLLDGTPESRIIAELFNWTGKAYKIPRALLSQSADRVELFKAGVYFLLGRDDIDPEKPLAYVGEAEEVYKRLLQHNIDPNKDYWNEAVVFISKDSNLNKAHIKFLEFMSYDALKVAKRAEIRNGNTPPLPVISEAEGAVMSEFFENIKLLVGALGYRIFEPLESRKSAQAPQQSSLAAATDELFISRSDGGVSTIIATGAVTNEGFIVREGSTSQEVKAGIPEHARKLRVRLIEDGTIEQVDGAYRFKESYRFSSPSTAATIILGTAANGRATWKNAQGQSINTITASQLAQAGQSVPNPLDASPSNDTDTKVDS